MNTKRNGFTLIEMFVVITIIGLLMAMISGALYTARERSRKVRAEVQLRDLVNAWTQYYVFNENTSQSDLPDVGGSDMNKKSLKPLLEPKPNGTLYLNIRLKDDEYRDPWGTMYKVKFTPMPQSTETITIKTSVSFQNRNRE